VSDPDWFLDDLGELDDDLAETSWTQPPPPPRPQSDPERLRCRCGSDRLQLHDSREEGTVCRFRCQSCGGITTHRLPCGYRRVYLRCDL
jgi:hypothetical protein